MKYGINISRWQEWKDKISPFTPSEIDVTTVICAHLDSAKHNLEISDIVEFMKQYELEPWNILKCATK